MLDTALGDLRALSAQLGEFDDMNAELAKVKAEADAAAGKLAMLKQEFADLNRQRTQLVRKMQLEQAQLTSDCGVKQRERDKLDVELSRKRAELEKIKTEFERFRKLVGG
jgi:predicted RNase H-like nuclease (RuvC/YqgF family)